MPKIHVDEQVMAELKSRSNEKNPNDLIRKLLGLSLDEPQTIELGVFLVPHGPKEFKNAEKLSDWLRNELPVSPLNGEYLVASDHYWRNVSPGSICLFHKKKMIVGEGKLIGRLMPYSGKETSPETGMRYGGEVYFDPVTIKVYKKPIAFSEAEKLLGKKLTFRGIQRLTIKDYGLIQSIL